MNRPTWDEYFMKIAEIIKLRADCLRRRTGALIVKDHRILTSGYNGTPHGIKNCSEGGCERCLKREKGELLENEDKHKCVCIHAEQNAILQAAYLGVSTKGATLYATDWPCWACAKLIINAGIIRVVAKSLSKYQETEKFLQAAGIELKVIRFSPASASTSTASPT